MYIPTIGLEIHIELNTKTKMFCPCLNDPEEKNPNVNICPICLGHPGTLPVPNKEAIDNVLKLGLAIGGKIKPHSHFDRKSYFYPDLPKGYQISQYDEPFIEHGMLKGVRITRVHLEEDAGRLTHKIGGVETKNASYVDFNRAGMPLMELVTEPDINSGKEAVAFAKSLQQLVRYLHISDADMEKGQMRIEVNISVRKNEKDSYGTKVEIKNLNSFKVVESAIEFEKKRQIQILENGQRIIHETRGWNEFRQVTEGQRSKEEAHDYRYFAEPDIPLISFSEEEIELLVASLPELPEQKKIRFMREYSLDESRVEILIDDLFWADFYEESASELGERIKKPDYLLLFNYLTSDLWGIIKENKIKKIDIRVSPTSFAELIALLQNGKCSSRIAKNILQKMIISGDNPEEIMENENIVIIDDGDALLSLIDEIIKKNEKVVNDYRSGKIAVLQFLIGQGMAKTQGQANPEKLRELFIKKLG